MKRFLRFFVAIVVGICSFYGFSGCKKEAKAYARYEITAEFSRENRTVAGTVKCTFENTTDNELSVLKFQIYPNAYRKNALYRPVSTAYENSAYYAGESYGEITISSVNGSKNWEIMGDAMGAHNVLHHK